MKRTEKKQRHKLGIRVKLVIFLTAFTALSLVLLLLFQMFFMDDFYENIKIQTIKRAAREISKVTNTSEIEEHIDYWNVKEQLQILVVDAKGEVVAAGAVQTPFFELLSEQSLQAVYNTTVENGGEYLARQEFSLTMPPPDHGKGERPPRLDDPNDRIEPRPTQDREKEFEVNNGVVYALICENGNMVMVSTIITPVNATIGTLFVQFIIAAVILIAFTVLLALHIARSLARPIEHLNLAAKGLADGTYQSPNVRGYKEIEELQQTLSEVSVELEKTEKLQQELLANVSHDLRTPLTMITGYSEAIRDLPGEDSAENIQVVIDEANRLTALVNDVLDYSKMQSGVRHFNKESLEISSLLKRTVDRCQTLVTAEAYVIKLTCEGEATVYADETRLTQVMYNLLGNALAHTGEDMTVSVALTVYEDRVRISVSDTGNGIAPEEIDNIWKRYYQTKSTHRRRQMLGTGIGLSIVKMIVEGHDGVCGVDSELGKGSTFWIELPRES